MSIHVVQLGPYPPPEGGISRHMLAIRDRLREQGDRCSIIATSRSSRIADEADVYHPGSAAKLLSKLRQLDFDVLHLHIGGNIGRRLLGLAVACSVAARGKSVLTIHSGAYPQADRARRAARASLTGVIFRRFVRVIAINEELADLFRRFGVAEDKISIVPPHALTMPDKNVKIPEELAAFIDKHSPLLLSVGGLERDYDPLMQIVAMKDVIDELPGAGLILVGEGSMRAEVERTIGDHDLAGSIYVAGDVEHAITLRLIDQADAMLRTTLFDGDAISVREALYLGTPVIATNTGSRPAGTHLIPIGDSEALTNAVRNLPPKTERAVNQPDHSNIDTVIDLYRQMISK